MQSKSTGKNLNDFLKNYSSAPKLHKDLWKFGRVDWNDFKKYPNDYHAANTGSVPGCIYCADTVKFAKSNLELIHDGIRDFESNCGKIANMPKYRDGETDYYDWLTCFAWSSMAGELINYLEEC